MIIKSHVRGGYRQAAEYLKEQGQNEKTRLVEISDPDTKNLDTAFQKMWEVTSSSKVKKPLHHISINPFKDERLTDTQVRQIAERCEQKYGYTPSDHQRVIVEHIKDGRQHFHVMWNRVSLTTGKAVWPGHHWKKSKQVCREMEDELGLKRPGKRSAKIGGLRAKSRVTRIEGTAKIKAKHKKFGSSPIGINPPEHSSTTARPPRHYAALLSEVQVTEKTKKKEGKGDGSGGGAASTASALKSRPKSASPIKKGPSNSVGRGNGPERRRKNMWVAVERREQRPKS